MKNVFSQLLFFFNVVYKSTKELDVQRFVTVVNVLNSLILLEKLSQAFKLLWIRWWQKDMYFDKGN